jgi:hypothetical protein
MAAKSTRQVTPLFLREQLHSRSSTLVTQLFLSHEMRGQADAACELWQTECLYGTVFVLRVLFVRMQHARRTNRAGDSNPARN